MTAPLSGPEIIERVIDASHGRQHDGDIRGAWRDAILDVLDAIREPSAAMLREAEDDALLCLCGRPTQNDNRRAFGVMIDALRREIAG